MSLRRLLRALPATTALALVLATGCATTITPIDLHDPVVPVASRRLIADGQDAVSIARARRDDARRRLDQVDAWQWDIANTDTWPADANAKAALRKFASARLALARLEFDYATANLDLPEAKYTLATAQTAIRHDLATYELDPLRDAAEAARTRVGTLKGELQAKLRELDTVTAAWWQAYGAFAKAGGETREFYTSFGQAR